MNANVNPKLIKTLIILSILLCISIYINWDSTPETPVMDEQTSQQVQTAINNMVELGKKRKWKDFNQCWVTVPKGEDSKNALFFLKNYKTKLDYNDIMYVDPEAKTIEVSATNADGLPGIFSLEKKDDVWKIATLYLP